MTSPIYRFPWLLDLAMRAKYRSYYGARLDRVCALVPEGARVVDLCAGSGAIYRHGLGKRVEWYRGFEISESMVRRARARGLPIEQADARTVEIPDCDVVLCLDSLYQFGELATAILQRAANQCSRLILLEPVDNVVQSDLSSLAGLAAWITDYGEGPVHFRHTESSLREAIEPIGEWTLERIGADLLAHTSRAPSTAE